MKRYEKPEIESVLFNDTDVMTTSSQVTIDLPIN